jgi:hypothetical protein
MTNAAPVDVIISTDTASSSRAVRLPPLGWRRAVPAATFG